MQNFLRDFQHQLEEDYLKNISIIDPEGSISVPIHLHDI